MKPRSYLICQVASKAIETGIEAIASERLGNRSAGCFGGDPILQV